MKRFFSLLMGLSLLIIVGMNYSCKPVSSAPSNDTTLVAQDSLALQNDRVDTAPDNQMTDEYIAQWVERVYQKVNEVWSRQEVHQEELDTAFFAKSYLDLKLQVFKLEDGKNFDDLFFIEYMPFTQGLRVPIKVSNVKPEILTGNIAGVSFDISDDDGNKASMWWHLDYTDGQWRIDDYKNDPDDKVGIADKMYEYIQANSK